MNEQSIKQQKDEAEIARLKARFKQRVCKGCIYYESDRKIGFANGYCDYLERSGGHSRIKNTPPEQMYKTCPLRRTAEQQPREERQRKQNFSIKKTARTKETNPAMANCGRKSSLGPIEALEENGEVVGIFESVKEAAAVTGLPVRKVYKLLAGETKHNDTGYLFRKES